MLRMLGTRHVSLLHLFSPPEQIAKVAQSQNFSGKCLMGEASLMLQRGEKVRFCDPSVREGDVPICGGCPNRGFKPPCILEISQSLVMAAQGVRGAAAVEPPALSSFYSRLFPPFPFLFLSPSQPACLLLPIPPPPSPPHLPCQCSPSAPCSRPARTTAVQGRAPTATRVSRAHPPARPHGQLTARMGGSLPARAATQGAKWRFFFFFFYCYFSHCMEGPSRPACSGDCL